MKTPEFGNKQELFAWLVTNKATLIAAKKAALKFADAVEFHPVATVEEEASKGNTTVTRDATELKVKAVINTTNLLDGHGDVHLPGLWSKSLKENKNILHLQEHELKFDHIIADRGDVKAYVQTMTWKELGFNYPGVTEALIFESTVKATRNAAMFGEYKAGNVTNHSVGMRYVKIDLAVDDKKYFPEEFAIWEKYIDQVANRKEAEEKGYFWAVHEAKVVEGSAVPLGSNWATPTLENDMEPPTKGTPEVEPSRDTPMSELILNRKILI